MDINKKTNGSDFGENINIKKNNDLNDEDKNINRKANYFDAININKNRDLEVHMKIHMQTNDRRF